MKQPVPVTLDTDNLSVLQIGAGLEYRRDAAYDQYFPTTLIMFGEQIRGWMKAIGRRLSKIARSMRLLCQRIAQRSNAARKRLDRDGRFPSDLSESLGGTHRSTKQTICNEASG